jgi:protein-S-isoprenylcysteine O-methyltransferase Ste14
MTAKLARLAGLVLTVGCWVWARDVQRSATWNWALIWGTPLLAFPITLAGRRFLDTRPAAARVQWANIAVHYAMMIVLGCAIFPAARLGQQFPGPGLPLPRQLGLALLIITGFATLMTVLNLALRGLGAPFAARLSSRLAVDWMYAWTRNPMLLSTLALLVCMGLWNQSLGFVLWVLLIVSPGWIFFVWIYEQRELDIRFGSAYRDYKARTPFLWPHRPRAAAPPARKSGATAGL